MLKSHSMFQSNCHSIQYIEFDLAVIGMADWDVADNQTATGRVICLQAGLKVLQQDGSVFKCYATLCGIASWATQASP